MVPSLSLTSMLGRSLQSEPGASGMWRIRPSTRALMSCGQKLWCYANREDWRRENKVTNNPHLADVVSENGLVLCASDLPLEPGLRLSVVGNLQRRRTVADLGQIRHGVSDCDGSVDSTISSVERQDSVLCSSVIFTIKSRETSVYITVWRYWQIFYHPPPRLENKPWEQTHAEARGTAAAPHQEQQPGLLPCGGSGQHHTDQPNKEGSRLGF